VRKTELGYLPGRTTTATVEPTSAASQQGGALPPSQKRHSGQGRFVELEAYRGIAALLIVVYHAYQNSRVVATYVYEHTPIHVVLRNLEAGVAWFFVLSGFLIALPFVHAALEQRQPQSARGFLIRRLIRIMPLYYAAILFVWSLRFTGFPDQWLDLLEHLTFTHIFDRTHIFWTIGPAWSLADEVLFYVFVAVVGPLAYCTCSRLATRRARVVLLVGGVVVLGGASVAYKWWAFYVAHIPEENYPVYFGPAAKLDTFAIGMLLAIIVAVVGNRHRFRKIASALTRLTGFALLATTFFLRSVSTFVEVYFHTLSGVAFALVLASTVLGARPSRWERVLAHPLLQFLGLISYSLYLWHEPVLIDLTQRHVLIFASPATFPFNTLALIVISITVATISYWAIEYPTMLLRHLFTPIHR
jgi:peptidoglycan/LPS O-acetylase OafA/YrhL